MRRQGSHARLHRWLVPATVLLALLTAAVWAHEHWGQASGTTLAVPVAPGRLLHLNVWKPGPAYAPRDVDRHDRLLPGNGPMKMAIWYQDRGAVITQRLAIFDLPAWPLMVLTASASLLLLGLWRTRARS